MAGLLDMFGGGNPDFGATDPASLYGGLLSPQQNRAIAYRGLLGAAGALGQAAMPSRMPIPIGAALGTAAGAMGQAQNEAGTEALKGGLLGLQGEGLQFQLGLKQALLNMMQGNGGTSPNIPTPGPTGITGSPTATAPGAAAPTTGAGGWGKYATPALNVFQNAKTPDGTPWSPAAIQGAMANGLAEGGFNTPWKKAGGGENSYGHWQFNENGELPGYEGFVGVRGDQEDTATQAAYVVKRMNEIDPNYGKTADPKAATDAFQMGFEKPAKEYNYPGARYGDLATAQMNMMPPPGAPPGVQLASAGGNDAIPDVPGVRRVPPGTPLNSQGVPYNPNEVGANGAPTPVGGILGAIPGHVPGTPPPGYTPSSPPSVAPPTSPPTPMPVSGGPAPQGGLLSPPASPPMSPPTAPGLLQPGGGAGVPSPMLGKINLSDPKSIIGMELLGSMAGVPGLGAALQGSPQYAAAKALAVKQAEAPLTPINMRGGGGSGNTLVTLDANGQPHVLYQAPSLGQAVNAQGGKDYAYMTPEGVKPTGVTSELGPGQTQALKNTANLGPTNPMGGPSSDTTATPSPYGMLPPLSEQKLPASAEEAKAAIPDFRKKITEWTDAAAPAQQAEMRLVVSYRALQSLQSGTWTTEKASLTAALQGAGINVPDNFLNASPADAQKVIHEAVLGTLPLLKAGTPRPSQLEFNRVAENLQNPNLKPEANQQIMAEGIAMARQAQAMPNAYKMSKWEDPQGFETSYLAHNDLTKQAEGVKSELGPLAGMNGTKAIDAATMQAAQSARMRGASEADIIKKLQQGGYNTNGVRFQ